MNPATILPKRFPITSAAVATTSSNNLSERRYVPLAMKPNINNGSNKNSPESTGGGGTGGLPYPVVGITVATPLPAASSGSLLTVIPTTAMAFVNAEQLQLSSNCIVANDDPLRTAVMHPILITTNADDNGGSGGCGTTDNTTATLPIGNCFVVGAENGDAGEVNLVSATMPAIGAAVGSHANPASAVAAASAIMQAGSSGNTSSILLCNQPTTFGNAAANETKTNSKLQSFDMELLKQIVGNAPKILVNRAPPQQLPPARQKANQQQKVNKKQLKNRTRPQPFVPQIAGATKLMKSAASTATHAEWYNSQLSLPAGSELSKIHRHPGDIVEHPQNIMPTKPASSSTVLAPKGASSYKEISEPLPLNTNVKMLTNSIMTTDATVTSLPSDITITTTPAIAAASNDAAVVVEDNDELTQKCEPQQSSYKVTKTMHTKATEKQESLLKSTSIPKSLNLLIETTTSPRSKQRANSLNSAPAVEEIEDVACGERRHSHPTEILERVNCTLDVALQQDGKDDNKHKIVTAESHKPENIKPIQGEPKNIEVPAVNIAQTMLKNSITFEQHQQHQQQQEAVNPNSTNNLKKLENPAAAAVKTEPIDIEDCQSQLIPILNSKENFVSNQSNLSQSSLLDKSVLSNGKITLSSSTSTSNSSSSNNSVNMPTSTHLPRPLRTQPKPQIQLRPQAQLLKAHSKKASPPSASLTSTSDMPTVANNAPDDSFATVVTMLSAFNTLHWKERLGTARSTNMCFVLNDFNLVQLHERCPTRNNIHTAYEKPISERTQVPKMPNQPDPLLYMCKRCNCYGPAAEFLGPDYCSLACLKRTGLKRQRDATNSAAASLNLKRKRSRKEMPANQNSKKLCQNKPANPSAYKRVFRWSTYVTAKCEAIAAPVDLFLNPFPTGANRFTIGMKLEAIDPANCSLFCVATVVDIQGYRIKLNLDGYAYMYDFWVNADSMDIFPPGWCYKTGRTLQPPKDMDISLFSWTKYINEKKAPPAPRGLFTHLNSSSTPTQNPFKMGMHLEAEDLNDTGKLCVATVADILNNRIRIHFDGWAECYDYWVDINSPYIHPCGWHQGRRKLFVPPGLENSKFTWPDYIKCKRPYGIAAPADIFAPRNPIDFKPGMKLEVVDPRNTSLIRPATIHSCNGHRVKLHLDGWASDYCFWLEDDSPDLHPMGWCDATGHELEPPPGYKMRPIVQICHINGCRGIGNAKEFYLNSHSWSDCCPYEPSNWSKKVEKPKRIEPDDHILAVPRTTKTPAAKAKVQYQKRKPMGDALTTKPNAAPLTRPIAPVRMQYGTKAETTTNVFKNGNYAVTEIKKTVETVESIGDDGDDIPTCSTKSLATIVKRASTSSASSSTSKTYDETELAIAERYLIDYGPRLQQNYDIWLKNSTLNLDQIKRNPLYWSTTETCTFVERVLNSHTLAKSFQHQDIDGEALLLLSQTDLTEIFEMKLGPAVKLFSSIIQLRTLVVRKFDTNLKLEC